MMFKRQMFICSAIEKCRETVNCCPHKQPHIKDERCVPRECRYAPGVGNIDCDLYDPENPRAPVPEPVITKTVEQAMKENIVFTMNEGKETVEFVTLDEVAKEQDIKEAVKEAAQRPVTVIKAQKKGGRKKA